MYYQIHVPGFQGNVGGTVAVGEILEVKLFLMSGWKWDEAPPEIVRHSGGEIAVSLSDFFQSELRTLCPHRGLPVSPYRVGGPYFRRDRSDTAV